MIADFGTNYTAIGWLTLILPVGFVAAVAALLWRALKRDKGDAGSPDR